MTGGSDVKLPRPLRYPTAKHKRGDTVRWYTSPIYGQGHIIGRTHIVRTSDPHPLPSVIETVTTYCGAHTSDAIPWEPTELCAKCWKFAPGFVQERIPAELRP
jgi:hypothetical protein